MRFNAACSDANHVTYFVILQIIFYNQTYSFVTSGLTHLYDLFSAVNWLMPKANSQNLRYGYFICHYRTVVFNSMHVNSEIYNRQSFLNGHSRKRTAILIKALSKPHFNFHTNSVFSHSHKRTFPYAAADTLRGYF